jgi:hypothetical protein
VRRSIGSGARRSSYATMRRYERASRGTRDFAAIPSAGADADAVADQAGARRTLAN